MKKLFLGISAMFLFLVNTVPAWSQWPELDPDSMYDTMATVDDGFGGTWNFSGKSFKHLGPTQDIFLWRPSGKLYPPIILDKRHYFNEKLKFNERSLPVEAGINLAFYGYLTELNKKGAYIGVLLWVNLETGGIDDVTFYISTGRIAIMFPVPPRCFTLYEDILKKTVKFDIPDDIFDSVDTRLYGERDPKDGIYYRYRIRFPAPAKGEPDFLALPADK